MLCNTEVGKKVQQYYMNFVAASNIKGVFNLHIPHIVVRQFIELLSIKNICKKIPN